MPNQAAKDVCLAGNSLSVPKSEISIDQLPIHHVAMYHAAVGIERFGTVLFTQEDATSNYVFMVGK